MAWSQLAAAVGMTATLFAASAFAADPANLVNVEVKGTVIDVLPTYVDVLTDDPVGQAEALLRRGGTSTDLKGHQDTFRTVTFNGVLYFFAEPEQRNAMAKGHRFRNGDVVYGFTLASPAEAAEFVKRYKLKWEAEITSEKVELSLFRASPGYFVVCLVPGTHFRCSMHPRIQMQVEHKCPICGMDLIPIEVDKPYKQPKTSPVKPR